MIVSYGRRLCLVVFSVLAIGLAAVPVTAQILYGSVVGVVKDAQGATVPGATVTIVNKETNLTRDSVTNAEGALQPDERAAGPVRRQGLAARASAKACARTCRSRSARSPAST